MKIRIGTRGSALALYQSRLVASYLHEITGEKPELVVVHTSGDKDRTSDLATFGGTGAFTKELDHAQLRHEFEVSVHSLKDLPTADRGELLLVGVPERAPVEDCLVSHGGETVATLPQGAVVGTGSARRRAQLLRLRPDLEVCGMRGNVGTRIEKVRRGEVAATLLARAGLTRLELMHEAAEVIDVERMVPAAAQGALGIVVYAGADEALAAVKQLDHPATHAAADAERAVLRALGGGCHLPVGAYAHQPEPGRLLLRTRVVSTEGERTIETSHEAPLDADPATWGAAANTLGERAAVELIEQGAEELLG